MSYSILPWENILSETAYNSGAVEVFGAFTWKEAKGILEAAKEVLKETQYYFAVPDGVKFAPSLIVAETTFGRKEGLMIYPSANPYIFGSYVPQKSTDQFLIIGPEGPIPESKIKVDLREYKVPYNQLLIVRRRPF